MLTNIFKVILRDLFKDKTYATISIVGLAAAISVTILIIAINISLITHDKFHEKGDRIYQAFCKNNFQEEGTQFSTVTSCLLGEALTNKYPEIKNSVTVKYEAPVMFIVGDNPNLSGEQTGFYSENSLFTIFSFPVIRKNSKEIFKDDNSIAISEDIAKKYFGNVPNAIGKRIILRRSFERKEAYVSSVFENIPDNSSFKFDYVLPLSSILKRQEWMNAWGSLLASTFFELKPNVDVKSLNKKIKNFINEHNAYQKPELFLFKYEDVFLKRPGSFDKTYTIIINYVFAFIILLIAAINFINLATSRAAKKSKEISLRKIAGAKRRSLIFRFMTENFMLSLIAVMLGLLIAELIIPYVNKNIHDFLILSIPYNKPNFIISITILWVVVGLLSGLYPSLYLSGLSPVGILKGGNEINKQVYLRKILITTQFVFSTLFIFIVIVLYKQMRYITDKDLGLNIKKVVEFKLTDNLDKHFNAFSNELKNNPKILGVTTSSFEPVEIGASTAGITWEGKPESLKDMFPIISVSDNYLKTFGMKLVKGRDFLEGDSLDITNCIINERMAKIIGKDNPVGLEISLWGDQGQIIGVVKDFQNVTLQKNINPLIIRKRAGECSYCFIKIHPKDLTGALKFIEKTYAKYEEEYPFKYSFLDDEFLNKHVDVKVMSSFFNLFSVIAIIISCMGLFGLTAFTIQQKTKEVGIRKVLGASVSSISILLTKSAIKFVLIGAVIALPVGLYLTRLILQTFVYKIEISADIYLISFAVVLILASGTVIFQALRAALVNPAESLKYE